MLCSQVMVLGSQSVDFLNTDLTNHVDGGLFIRDLDEIEDNYDTYHDYNINASSIDPCDLARHDSKDVSDEQISSPGIIMIVEAEDIEYASLDDLSQLLAHTLENDVGFMVTSSSTHQNEEMNQVSIILHEGYVMARTISEHKYFGFEIHLWSSFDKHVKAKNSLLTAVGGKAASLLSSSSFRIIAGGVFGAVSWKEDEKVKGPQEEDLCSIHQSCSFNIERSDVRGIIDSDIGAWRARDNAIEVSVTMLQGTNQVVALLCGAEDNCSLAHKKVESIDSVTKVVLLSCPSMLNFTEYGEDASQALSSCEQHLAKVLTDALSNDVNLPLIDTVIIDESADKISGSIFLKVLQSKKKLANSLFKSQVKIISTCMNESEKWRVHIVKAFANTVLYSRNYGFYTEVKFHGENGSFKLAITSSGEEHFINALQNSMMHYEAAITGMSPTILSIIGGKWDSLHNPYLSRVFTPDDYDQSSSFEQWKSQIPLGHQVIFQMELLEMDGEIDQKDSYLTDEMILDAVTRAVSDASLPLIVYGEDTSLMVKYNDAGDGCVVVFMWDDGSVVALWNGRDHVDVNVFVYGMENIDDLLSMFESSFLESLPGMQLILRDDHPRGVGRVISYREDIEDGLDPHWAV